VLAAAHLSRAATANSFFLALRTKCAAFSTASKSAMTPFRIGHTGVMFIGVPEHVAHRSR
jgi:hypothetical protein